MICGGPVPEIITKHKKGPERTAMLEKANIVQGQLNFALVAASAGIIANLDGQDVDSGTACEIGYGLALGKPIVGIRTDFRICADNEGCGVNLMIEGAIQEYGGKIYESEKEAVVCM